MEKYLSELQRELLLLAFKNPYPSTRAQGKPDLSIRRAMRGRTPPYRTTRITLIQSLKRLETRGLVKLIRYQPLHQIRLQGINLTESGKEVAKRIAEGF